MQYQHENGHIFLFYLNMDKHTASEKYLKIHYWVIPCQINQFWDIKSPDDHLKIKKKILKLTIT